MPAANDISVCYADYQTNHRSFFIVQADSGHIDAIRKIGGDSVHVTDFQNGRYLVDFGDSCECYDSLMVALNIMGGGIRKNITSPIMDRPVH